MPRFLNLPLRSFKSRLNTRNSAPRTVTLVRSSTSRRTLDRMRSGQNTVLTSGSGVSETAATGKKTLLGQ